MSSELSSALLKDIQANYGFKSVQAVRSLGGLSASNHIIEAGGKQLVLKKYRSKKPDVVMRIEDNTAFLHQHHIPVVMPLTTKARRYHFGHAGSIYAIYPKIEWQVLHEPSLSPNALSSAATLLAQFHKAGQQCKLPLSNGAEKLVPKAQVRANAKELRQLVKAQSLGAEVDGLTTKLLTTKLTLLDKLMLPEELTKYFAGHDLVHGDFHNENLLFSSTGKVTCLLDFEEMHFGRRVEDVLNFIHLACCNSGHKEENIDKARHFLKTYASIHYLTQRDILYGTHYSLYRFAASFFLEAKLYTQHELFLTQFLQRDLGKFTYFLNHLDEFVQKLLE